MKDALFAELQEAVRDVIAYRRGDRSRGLKVSRFVSPKPLKAAEIRRIRAMLKISQPMFARFLGTSVASVRSWEQGSRRPRSAALRLLCIAKKSPAVFLEKERISRKSRG
jgi:DNA-binding transcriptional regulator YiaG